MIISWKDQRDTTVHIRFSWPSLSFLTVLVIFLFVEGFVIWVTKDLHIDTLFYWIPLCVSAAICGTFVLRTWLEYQSALRFLSREMGLAMDGSRDIRERDIS